MTDQSNPEVSQAIRAQLGGALAMLGAKDLMRTADSLSFRIRGSKLANHITITLDAGADEYVVRFCKIARRPSYAIVSGLRGRTARPNRDSHGAIHPALSRRGRCSLPEIRGIRPA